MAIDTGIPPAVLIADDFWLDAMFRVQRIRADYRENGPDSEEMG